VLFEPSGTNLYARLLGVATPWYVESVTVDNEKDEVRKRENAVLLKVGDGTLKKTKYDWPYNAKTLTDLRADGSTSLSAGTSRHCGPDP
jgi:hypothetical protein